jgi:hypothetical protein
MYRSLPGRRHHFEDPGPLTAFGFRLPSTGTLDETIRNPALTENLIEVYHYSICQYKRSDPMPFLKTPAP